MTVTVRRFPLVRCVLGRGRPRILNGFIKGECLSGLFFPCGGLLFQPVENRLLCCGAFAPHGKKLRQRQRGQPGKIGLFAFKVNPALNLHGFGGF